MIARYENDMPTPSRWMNRHLRQLASTPALLLLLASTTPAQEPDRQWENLRTLRSGEKIQVIDQRLRSLKGTLIGVSETEISLKTENEPITLPRGDVHRVTSLERGHGRLFNAMIGLAVGAGVGAAAGASAKGDSELFSHATGTAVAAAGFGAIGFGVGAALPPRRPVVFRQERPNGPVAP